MEIEVLGQEMSKVSNKTYPFSQIAISVTDRVQPAETDLEFYVGLEHLDPESLKIRRWGSPSDVKGQKLLFRKGDIIFAKRRAYQRKLGVAEFDGICSAHALVLRPKTDVILPEFLPFFLQSDLFMNRAIEISVGSLSPTINWRTLQKEEFPLPPIDEQRRIAKLLISIDALKSKYRNLLEVHNILFKSLAQELFLPKDNSSSDKLATFEDMNIEIIDGDRGKAYPKRSQLHEAGYCLFLNAKNVSQRGFVFSECEFISKERDTLLRKGKLIRNDVVLTTRGTLGNVAHYDASVPYENLRINSGMVIFRCDNSLVNPRYLYWLFKSPYFQNQIEKFYSGSAQPQLPIKLLNQFKLPFFDIDEQKRIVGIFNSWDISRGMISLRLQSTTKMLNAFLSKSLGNIV